MNTLWRKHPSTRDYLPCEANGFFQFSDKKAEDIHPNVTGWNVVTFNAWNPQIELKR